MTNSITFTVEGVPVPWARAGSRGKRRYTPASMAVYKLCVGMEARMAMKAGEPSRGPVEIRYSFGLPVPKSWSKKDRAAALRSDIFPTVKPDLDNLEKLISDALKQIVYDDDKQICDSYTTKRYSGRAGVTVTVKAL